jgi:hypothetical protein
MGTAKTTIKRFSDVRPRFGEGADYVKVDDLVDQPLILKSFQCMSTQWGEAAIIDATHRGKGIQILTWSAVLIQELRDIEKDLPVSACIRRVGRYFTFA